MIASFLLIIISGQHFGGFYLLYLLLALPYGGIHALLAVAGIVCLALVNIKASWERNSVVRLGGAILGTSLLVASLVLFFINDKQGYNSGTFEQFVPLATLGLFTLIAILFVAANCYLFFRGANGRNNLFTY